MIINIQQTHPITYHSHPFPIVTSLQCSFLLYPHNTQRTSQTTYPYPYNKFTRQYNYTLIFLWRNVNIINTRKMIPSCGEVKIEENSSLAPLLGLSHTPHTHIRPGNSRSFAKTGHWTEEEKLKYLLFIDHHKDILATNDKRPLWRIFCSMAAFIGTRRPAQCRTHHLKMEHYYQSLPNILTQLKKEVHNYPTFYQQAYPRLRALSLPRLPLHPSGVFLEDRPNNEQGVPGGRRGRGGRRRSSTTSIRLEDEEKGHWGTDKDLPKTDHSLHILPQPHHHPTHPLPASRPHLDYSQLQGDALPYNNPNFPFRMPFPFLTLDTLFGGGINETSPSFFELHRRHCANWQDAMEWAECERLYRLWRNTLQSLIHSNL